ncbi:CGGC domain-containing protein [Syntrophomonas palmitatica]|uniref:CGGC domain-containing protein n=1 Tax=Syntrophomonas palmitatica TaxID=402877 RepID=UPI0009F88C8D|nr:CGGC domain-containing protein [Syntrophomonas palmitatica]
MELDNEEVVIVKWTEEAQAELQKIPAFVRDMAVKAVESEVTARGDDTVTAEDLRRSREKYIAFAEDKPGQKKKTRIAVVRCETVSEVCPGVACMAAFNRRQQYFKSYGDEAEIIGFFTCGGCPGRRVSRLMDSLKKHKLDVVHLSSCMGLSDNYIPCPHYEEIRKSIENKGIKVVDGTHH